MTEKRFGALSSSVNPQELSLTVQAGARFLLALLVSAGWITSTGADTTLESIPAFVTTGYAAWQALEVLWGLVRKVIVALSKPK